MVPACLPLVARGKLRGRSLRDEHIYDKTCYYYRYLIHIKKWKMLHIVGHCATNTHAIATATVALL